MGQFDIAGDPGKRLSALALLRLRFHQRADDLQTRLDRSCGDRHRRNGCEGSGYVGIRCIERIVISHGYL